MVDVVLQGAWVLHRINKDEGDKSLPLLAFRRNAVKVIFAIKYNYNSQRSFQEILKIVTWQDIIHTYDFIEIYLNTTCLIW